LTDLLPHIEVETTPNPRFSVIWLHGLGADGSDFEPVVPELGLDERGDARIEHKKFKEVFGKGKMLPLDEVVELTGHPVGGVCPFGLASPLPVYLDRSLLAFDEVLPAAGAIHSAVRISPRQMAEVTEGEWVDVCQGEAPPLLEA